MDSISPNFIHALMLTRPRYQFRMFVLIDFSLTVKAATLTFISGLGSAVSSAKEGKSGTISNLVKNKSVVCVSQTCVQFMKILTVYTLNSHLFSLKAHNLKMQVFVVH